MSPLLIDAINAGCVAAGVALGLAFGIRFGRIRTAREVLHWHQRIVHALDRPPEHMQTVLSMMLDRFDYLTLGRTAPVQRALNNPAGITTEDEAPKP